MSAETIIAVLSKIPWGSVVESAPKIASAASKLWNTVTRRNSGEALEAGSEADAAPPPTPMEILAKRVSEIEGQVADLHGQMGESAELIKALAEQNALLVNKIDQTNTRLFRLAWVAGACLLLLAGLLAYVVLAPR